MRLSTHGLVLMIARKYVAGRCQAVSPLSPLPSNRSVRSASTFSIPSTPPPPAERGQSLANGNESRKQKIRIEKPTPSEAYLTLSSLRSTELVKRDRPPLLVLDLNNTLLYRKEKSARGSRRPVARPHLADFFAYLNARDATGIRNWEPYVYSSARRRNVLSMLEGVGIGRHVSAVFAREDMGLTQAEYESNIETVKDLDLIWRETGWTARDTVLLDDEAFKAAKQPHNHLGISYFDELVKEDTALLETVARLDQMRMQSNFASYLRTRESDSGSKEDLASRGAEIVARSRKASRRAR